MQGFPLQLGLCVGCVNILSNSQIEQKLRSELLQAIPTLTEKPRWVDLERLPYLKACVYESIRLSYRTVSRLHRMAPDETLHYRQWAIPPGTPASQSTFIVNHSETIFSDSYSFRPVKMEKYLLSFTKGTCMCLGINLAFAELYKMMTFLFRHVEMELFETDHTDVELRHDWFVPGIKKDTKGIQVKVISVA